MILLVFGMEILSTTIHAMNNDVLKHLGHVKPQFVRVAVIAAQTVWILARHGHACFLLIVSVSFHRSMTCSIWPASAVMRG